MSHSPPPPSPSPPPPQDPLPMVVDPSSPVGSGDPLSQYIFAFPSSPPRPFDSYLPCSPILLVGEMPLSPLWNFDDDQMGATAQTIDSGARSSSYGKIYLDRDISLDREICLVDSEIPFDWEHLSMLVSLRKLNSMWKRHCRSPGYINEFDIFMRKWHCGSPGYTKLILEYTILIRSIDLILRASDLVMGKWHCGSPGYTNFISAIDIFMCKWRCGSPGYTNFISAIDTFMWKRHCRSPGYTNEIDIFMWKWHCGSPGYTNFISTCQVVVFHMPPRVNTGNIGDFIDLAAFKTVRRMYWIMNEEQKTTDAQMIQLKMPRLQYLGFLINRSPARRTPGPRIVFRCLLRFALSLLLLQYSAEQQKLRDVLKRHFTGESSNADSMEVVGEQPDWLSQVWQHFTKAGASTYCQQCSKHFSKDRINVTSDLWTDLTNAHSSKEAVEELCQDFAALRIRCDMLGTGNEEHAHNSGSRSPSLMLDRNNRPPKRMQSPPVIVRSDKHPKSMRGNNGNVGDPINAAKSSGKSQVWKHFVKDGERAYCIHCNCKKDYAADSRRDGTSRLLMEADDGNLCADSLQVSDMFVAENEEPKETHALTPPKSMEGNRGKAANIVQVIQHHHSSAAPNNAAAAAKPRATSQVWQHFSKDGSWAYCKHCNRRYAADPKKNGTSRLWRHLESAHEITKASSAQNEESGINPSCAPALDN